MPAKDDETAQEKFHELDKGTDMSTDTSTPSAEHYSAIRADVLNHAFNGLLLIHGGGITVLLGFLQQHWQQQPALSHAMLTGVAFMVAGLSLAIPIPLLRYRHSHLWQRRERARVGKQDEERERLDKKRTKYMSLDTWACTSSPCFALCPALRLSYGEHSSF